MYRHLLCRQAKVRSSKINFVFPKEVSAKTGSPAMIRKPVRDSKLVSYLNCFATVHLMVHFYTLVEKVHLPVPFYI